MSRVKRAAPVFCGLVVWCLTAPVVAVRCLAQAPISANAVKQEPFEPEIARFEDSDRRHPPPAGAVEFIGSSSIRFWTTLAEDFPEITVINRGFGGSTLADSVRYAPRILIPYKPRLVVLYAGTNDINSGKTPADVFNDYKAFVDEVHTVLPDTHIAYISINPATSRWSKEPRFLEANHLIQRYTRSRNGRADHLSFIDSHSKLLSEDGEARADILRSDGLHLNADGYKLWVSIVKRQILSLAKAAGRDPKDRP